MKSRQLHTNSSLYDKIQHALNICQKYSFFGSDAVFLIPILFSEQEDKLILVFNKNTEIPNIEYDTLPSDMFIIMHISDIYKMILEKNMSLYYAFHNAIAIHDKENLAPKILSAFKPILNYNKHLTNSYNCESQRTLTIKFFGVTTYQQFLSAMAFPICSQLGDFLGKCHLIFSGVFNQNKDINDFGIITIYSTEHNILKLKSYIEKLLYQNYNNWELYRIEFPNNSVYSGFFEFSDMVGDKTIMLLSNISTILLENYSNKEWIYNYAVSQLISLYITIGKIIFPNKKDFFLCNDLVMQTMLDSVASEFSLKYISFEECISIQKKLHLEYDHLVNANAKLILENYITKFIAWNSIEPNDEIEEILIPQLNYINSLIVGEHPQNDKDTILRRYFLELYRSLTSIFCIPQYFYPYIPHCIKFLSSYAI